MMPYSSASSRRPRTHSAGGTTNPPSPCTGSKTIAATSSAATCVTNIRRSAASASPAGSSPSQRYGLGNGARYTSGANGPMPALYGCCLEVSDMASSVRPWNAESNAITADRPVACRAILTAFSTASAPELKNAAFLAPEIGVTASRRSASST